MLSHNDLANELIRRRDHPPVKAQHPPPPPTRTEAPASAAAGTGNTTTTASSYEMVDPPTEEARAEQDGQRQRFWRLRRRAQTQTQSQTHHEQDEGIERRVVSQPEPTDPRKSMRMLDRLRLRRASEAGYQLGRDENVTIVTETDHSSSQDDDPSTRRPLALDDARIQDAKGSNPSTPGAARGHASADNSPSFISFSPATSINRSTPTSTSTSTSASRSSPHSSRFHSYSQTRGESRRTLAPALTTPARSPHRGAAVRAISLEARLADTSLGSSPSAEYSEEAYPSLIDSSSSFTNGLRGILRPKNARAPPNTPTPTVRFADTWLTGIKSPISKSRFLGRENELEVDRTDTLPPARLSGGARWKRLGVLLGAVDRTPALDASSPDVPISIPLRTTKSLSSDSPISFARFDRDDPLSHLTPVHKPKLKLKQRRTAASPTLQAGQHTTTPDTSSTDTASSPSFSSIPARPRMWSRRWSEEEVIIEPCSAIEALWEYGSSDSDREDGHLGVGDTGTGTGTGDSAEVTLATTTSLPLATYDIDPLSPGTQADPILITPPTATAPPRRPTLQDRRESGELIPLKYRGGSFDAAAQSDPFPFATALKF